MENLKDKINAITRENEFLEEKIKVIKAEIAENNKTVKKLQKLQDQIDEIFNPQHCECEGECTECTCEEITNLQPSNPPLE